MSYASWIVIVLFLFAAYYILNKVEKKSTEKSPKTDNTKTDSEEEKTSLKEYIRMIFYGVLFILLCNPESFEGHIEWYLILIFILAFAGILEIKEK